MGLTEDCVHISFRKEDFRVTFTAPFLVVFFSALFISEVFFLMTGNDSFQVLFLLVPGIVLVLCSTAVLILRNRYKFYLGPEGIQCCHFWRRPDQTQWDQVEDLKLVRTAGLEYLQVFVQGSSKAIWIPTFVKRDTTLRHLLDSYTHQSRELHQKLESIWPDQPSKTKFYNI